MRPGIFSLLIVLAAPIAICAQTPAFEVAAVRLNNDPPPQMGIGVLSKNSICQKAKDETADGESRIEEVLGC